MSNDDDAALRRRYRNAVDALPRKQREIFLAHLLRDQSYQQIAEARRLTIRQVERHIAKALYKIGKQIDGDPLSWWERWF